MEQEFRAVWAKLSTSRSTTSSGRPSRGTSAGVQKMAQALLRRAATSTKASTRAGTASVRGVQAGQGSRRRQVPDPPDDSPSGSARRTTSSGCRSISSALLDHFAAHPEFIQPDVRRNEILRLRRRRARGHLRQPRGPVVGHSAAVRPDERRLRLVRRADQLRVGGRLRHRRRAVRHVVAGGPSRGRQGHHAVPLRRSGRRC